MAMNSRRLAATEARARSAAGASAADFFADKMGSIGREFIRAATCGPCVDCINIDELLGLDHPDANRNGERQKNRKGLKDDRPDRGNGKGPKDGRPHPNDEKAAKGDQDEKEAEDPDDADEKESGEEA